MENNKIQSVESYITTKNEHWNNYTFKMLCAVIEENSFEDNEQPLELFSLAIGLFQEKYDKPLQAVEMFAGHLDSNSLFGEQRLFIYEWIHKYLEASEFDIDLRHIKKLIKSKIERLKLDTQFRPMIKDIRYSFKEMMQKEIEKLPAALESLEPMQRLTIVCKLMPFIMPKADNINAGESYEF